MEITFLYFKGCPNSRPALDLLKKVIKEMNINGDIKIVEIKSEEEALKYKFLGSPSIQLNGIDIEKERRNDPPSFGCRMYKAKNGFTGIPPKEMIVQAIKEMTSPKDNKVDQNLE